MGSGHRAGSASEPSTDADVPVPVLRVDHAGIITSWNAAAEGTFGWSAQDLEGHHLTQVLSTHDTTSERAVQSLLDANCPARTDLVLDCPDGSTRQVVATATHAVNATTQAAVYLIDISSSERERPSIAEASYRWRRLLENISDTVTVVDAQGDIIESTGQLGEILGYDSEWWQGKSALDMLHPDERAHAEATLAEVLETPGIKFRRVYRTRHHNGHYELIEYSVVNLLDDPAIAGIVISSGNITEVKRAEALVENEAGILELIARAAPLDETLPAIIEMVERHADSPAALLLLSPSGGRLHAGARGTMPDAAIEQLEATPVDATDGFGAAMGRRAPVIVRDMAMDQTTESLDAVGLRAGWSLPVIESRSGEVLGCITTVYREHRAPTPHEQDVGAVAAHLASIAIERDRFQQQLLYQARHHQLTGLPNRRSIKERIEQALAEQLEDDRFVAAMFIDLDRFKVVNDSFGHSSGDKLLVRFAGRLKNLIRPGDFVGHFAADEFVLVLEIVGMRDIDFIVNRIESALREPFELEEGEVFLSVSMGVAISDGPATTSESLLHQADAAMFRAKALGGGRLAVYDDAMQSRAITQLRVERDLRLAIEHGDLEVHYQPEIDLMTGRVTGAESLIRWQHAERGLVLPKDFIEVAENTGLIVTIGRFVLDESLRQARRWAEGLGIEDFVISVNLSARQLGWSGLVPAVRDALDQHRWPRGQLMLEITESVLIDDADAALSVLNELKDLGVRLAIDDFGTGYSSLSYLNRFPVDVVKIDRSFVTPLGTESGSPLASAVVQMSKALGMRTCAEGVETVEQLDALRDLGCDLAQGFWFAKALHPARFEELITDSPEW